MYTIKLLAAVSCVVSCIADGESLITKETDTDTDKCLNDDRVENICLKCTSFAFYAIPSVGTCCTDKSAFLLCEACVNDQDSCTKLLEEMEELDTMYDDDNYDPLYSEEDQEVSDDISIPITSAVEKRFGKLFVNRNPKRFGRLFFGKRSGGSAEESDNAVDKRFGRVFMGRGSYFGKRSEMDKRYGRLFTASNNYFGKRAPFAEDSAILDDNYNDDEPDGLSVSKRYGRVYMGNRRNKLYGKRYGRIFFGKRSDDDFVDMDKRYGRLFTGRRKYYFGK